MDQNDDFFDEAEETVFLDSTGLEEFALSRRQPKPREARKRTGAVVLLRVSSQRQLNTASDIESDGNSIATQREWAERKAREVQATVLKEFVEPGHSAQAIAKRPIFRQLLEFVRENSSSIGYVIIYSRSRAFRSIYDANDVEREFQTLGVELVSATEDFGSDPDQAAFMKQVTDGVNHLQVRANGRDVAKKMLHKVENGGSVGRAKLGYLNDRKEVDGRLVTSISIDSERAPLVKWAFEAYSTGEHSIRELRELLSDQGLTTRPTRRWPKQPISHSQLSNLLRDPYYAGVIRYKNQLYRGRHTPLISKDLFLRVQSVLNERAQRGQRDVFHHHWAKGLLWCGRCDLAGRSSRLILTEAKGNGGTYSYYICRGRQEGFCDLPSLPLAQVEQQLGRTFGSLAIGREFVEKIRDDVTSAVEQSQWMEREMRANVKTQLRKLNIKEERLLDLAADADLSTLRLGERLKAIQFQREELEERLQSTTELIERGANAVSTYLDILVQPEVLFERATDSARRGLLDAFYSQIWLDFDEPPHSEERTPVSEIRRAAETVRQQENRGAIATAASKDSSVGPLSKFILANGLSKPTLAGVPGLEPRTKESESSVLPITPYPTGPGRSRADCLL